MALVDYSKLYKFLDDIYCMRRRVVESWQFIIDLSYIQENLSSSLILYFTVIEENYEKAEFIENSMLIDQNTRDSKETVIV